MKLQIADLTKKLKEAEERLEQQKQERTNWICNQLMHLISGMAFNFNHSVPFELMPGDYFVYVKE